MPKIIKLTYFNLRGRGEPARLLLAYSGLNFEDERKSCSGLECLEAALAADHQPVLLWDGVIIKRAMAIDRFIATELGLAGEDNLQKAQVDEIIDVIEDALNAGYTAAVTKDEILRKKEMKKYNEETVPTMLYKMEKRLIERGGQYLVGNDFSWADIQLFYFCTQGHMEKLQKLPKISQLVQNVGEIRNIEEYTSYARPNTKF